MTRNGYARSEKDRATRRARETSPEYLAAQRERYQDAIKQGMCGRCQCRARLPHRTLCTRCQAAGARSNRKRDAGKPKRTCSLCRAQGHYSKTCANGCLVQQRFGRPCSTCAASSRRGDSTGLTP